MQINSIDELQPGDIIKGRYIYNIDCRLIVKVYPDTNTYAYYNFRYKAINLRAFTGLEQYTSKVGKSRFIKLLREEL